jgi:magnesium-transporting ATPase (P-type)
LIEECILSNTDVRVETNEQEFRYVPAGGALEVGMVNFLIDAGHDIRNSLIERNSQQPKACQFPFDQSLKLKTTCRVVQSNGQDQSKFIRVVVKGAPEVVLDKCTSTLNDETFEESLKQGIKVDVVEK